MKETFVEHKFSAESHAIIQTASGILAEYAEQGYRLSLRQLYYQLVARGLIENSLRSYKRIGSIVSDARLAGLLDWDMIEDRNREAMTNPHWNTPAEILESAAQQFRVDLWREQPYHVEVMVEKDALSGILWPVCQELDVRFTANKGYSSSSAMYEAGRRMARASCSGKKLMVLYLGDHDPSGIDMTRDIRERLEQFAHYERIELERLALNYDQVELWSPPENPAKESDSRFEAYAAEFGEWSWELDAVEPATLSGLVEKAIRRVIDKKKWKAAQQTQADMRLDIAALAAEWRAGHEEAP